MASLWKTSLLAAFLLTLYGCKPDPKPPVPRVFPAPAAFKDTLGRVFEGYVIVQGALAEDRLVLAKNALSAMHGVLHTLVTDGLDSAAKAHFDSTDMAVMSVLHDTSLAFGGLPEVRSVFLRFTPLLENLLVGYGVTEQVPVYLFHCPRAREGQGADWLQKDGNPANPYQGTADKTCGNLVRRLGA
jgi:hypothetical protein